MVIMSPSGPQRVCQPPRTRTLLALKIQSRSLKRVFAWWIQTRTNRPWPSLWLNSNGKRISQWEQTYSHSLVLVAKIKRMLTWMSRKPLIIGRKTKRRGSYLRKSQPGQTLRSMKIRDLISSLALCRESGLMITSRACKLRVRWCYAAHKLSYIQTLNCQKPWKTRIPHPNF